MDYFIADTERRIQEIDEQLKNAKDTKEINKLSDTKNHLIILRDVFIRIKKDPYTPAEVLPIR